MPTLNSQQGTPEAPGNQPGDFEIPHPERREGQEVREDETRIPRETFGQEANIQEESPAAIKRSILGQAEKTKPADAGEPVQKNPALNQLLTKIIRGEVPLEDLVIKDGEEAQQVTEFVNNPDK